MVTDFIDSIRKCFSDNGFGDGIEKSGGTFLVGYKSKLYKIDSDFQVGVPAFQYDTCGCGSDLALGAMYALKDEDPELRVRTALKAASVFSAGVVGPFKIVKLLKKK